MTYDERDASRVYSLASADQAQRLFTRGEQHSTLGVYFTERTLRLHIAHCYTEAGAPKRAGDLYGRILTGDALSRREIALRGARRALALARSGEPDEAAAVALKSAVRPGRQLTAHAAGAR